MSEFKVGDKVWVLCEVVPPAEKPEAGDVRVHHCGANFYALKSECRPVEPSNSPEIPDSSNDPLAPSPCMDGVDVDRFVDGVMEARGRTNDPVNPSHYKQGGIECIEAIKAALGEGFPDYLRGNVMKYLWRYKEKGGVEDLRKSAWYLDRLFKEAGE